MRLLIIYIILLFSFVRVTGQRNNAKHPDAKKTVIIDTDCGFDDFRAIAIMLSRPEIEIASVIASDGVLTASEGLKKIKELLCEYNADTLAVTAGLNTNVPAPAWRKFCEGISWGKCPIDSTVADINSILKNLLSNNSVYTLVCLGTLHTADYIRTNNPELYKKIDKIVWYNGSVFPLKGFN